MKRNDKYRKIEIRVIAKRFSKLRKRTLRKLGLLVVHDDSLYDVETRQFLAQYIPQKLNLFGSKDILEVLMLGSPRMQEIKDIPLEVLRRFSITGVDKKANKPPFLPVNSYRHYQMNVFDFFQENKREKYDMVLSRWFLHHISEHNKKTVCKTSYDLLNEPGLMIVIDWFVNEWETSEELFKSQIDFFEYRIKYLPHQHKKLEKLKRFPASIFWNRLHDDKDWGGGKYPTRNRLSRYLRDAGFANIELYDVGNKNIIDNPQLWGDVLVCAEKRKHATLITTKPEC